jgi:hypothetical protein
MALPMRNVTAAPTTAADTWAMELLDRAHERTVRTTDAEKAAFLQELVGQKLTALITGIDDPKAVGKWARGERSPRGAFARRLRDAFQVATLLALGESPQTARSWLLGMNPLLGDRAPAAVFAMVPDGGADAMRAARAFLAQG